MPFIAFDDLTARVEAKLSHNGLGQAAAGIVAHTIVAAQRDGAASHGLSRLPGYIAALRSGWVDGAANPLRVSSPGSGMVVVDAANGFAQPALRAMETALIEAVDRLGTAVGLIRNSHHFAALWPDVEPFAAKGLVVLTAVNSRPAMAVWGGQSPALGTNAIAFGCPRGGNRLPIVWDQASSVRSYGDVLIAHRQHNDLAEGVGLDAAGYATVDPGEILGGGSLLPFGGAKGASIAFMVEILAALCTGANFGFEDDGDSSEGAVTSKGGQFILLLRPPGDDSAAHDGYPARMETLVQMICRSGADRLPSDRRYAHRARSLVDGIEITLEQYHDLESV